MFQDKGDEERGGVGGVSCCVHGDAYSRFIVHEILLRRVIRMRVEIWRVQGGTSFLDRTG